SSLKHGLWARTFVNICCTKAFKNNCSTHVTVRDSWARVVSTSLYDALPQWAFRVLKRRSLCAKNKLFTAASLCIALQCVAKTIGDRLREQNSRKQDSTT